MIRREPFSANLQSKDKWISAGNEDAQHCKQKNFAKFRDEGKIRFSPHPEKRIILYDGDSIDQFLEKNAKMFLTIKNDPFDN